MFAFTDEPQTPGSLTGVDAISESRLLLAPVAKGLGGLSLSNISEADNIWLNFSDLNLPSDFLQSNPPKLIRRRDTQWEDK